MIAGWHVTGSAETAAIRSCDTGTAYARVLTAARAFHAGQLTDAEAMALFCENLMPAMIGTYSPRLIWEGAQNNGVTAAELFQLCARKDLDALDKLGDARTRVVPEILTFLVTAYRWLDAL